MPEAIHERARHLLAKNPDMKKSTAFAVATQQMEALGKTPKGFGTAEGKRTSKAKYDTPGDDVKTPNPGNLSTPKLKAASALQQVMFDAFEDELDKIAEAQKVAIIDTGIAALMGANKANAAGEEGTGGALRGGLGWLGGSQLGALGGAALGTALGHTEPVLPVLGYGLGGLAGYKALTGKYKEKK